ncbi:MAG: AmmeMemoRadiSam system radical SAM enzyme [Candidatus Eisenbacteria bacterium]|uniref:AmmeMemoRadiSam system radical SAM enzyme n=1 Tax=Eiseniibacteriota bacterium TaxID=2212470 RepID=A0A956RRC1_UNCEI|nr:AmmeMemoRadiSam system radical SAM enzyme [Candidatus Eisenbacteria bacterium]
MDRASDSLGRERSRGPSRRAFLRTSIGLGLSLAGLESLSPTDAERVLRILSGEAKAAGFPPDFLREAPRARYWTSDLLASDCTRCHSSAFEAHLRSGNHESNLVKCELCAQRCVLKDGDRGRCRARINVGGELRSLVYGRPITVHVDPIEKGPFYHFLPGSRSFCLATAGCPLSCKFCQNWEISQARPEDRRPPFTSAADLVSASHDRGVETITFTYNEPTVYAEYVCDVAREARRQGLRSTVVSCGFMTAAPLGEICDVIDAIKFDLKGFDQQFYDRVCEAELEPVLRSIRQVARSNVHLEVVNLVVPTLNDSDRMLRGLVDWMMGELGPDVPLHFSRFSPAFQLGNLAPTPLATLERARELAQAAGLRYVYVGNAPGHAGAHTYCPTCGALLIERSGFFVVANRLVEGTCGACGTHIPGVWL